MTTQSDIREWLEIGKEKGAAYMLVVCDTFDHEDYPVYFGSHAMLVSSAPGYHGPNMQRVMECYDLSLDWDQQLNQTRAWNGWRP